MDTTLDVGTGVIGSVNTRQLLMLKKNKLQKYWSGKE